MGTFADSMTRFAQPLIDATDGSPEQLQRALLLSQLCWNLALTPEGERDKFLADVRPGLKMNDREFEEFKRTVVTPMIHRHQEMFPAMQRSKATTSTNAIPTHAISPAVPQRFVKQFAGTGRNERCPCRSGKKYKICCGR